MTQGPPARRWGVLLAAGTVLVAILATGKLQEPVTDPIPATTTVPAAAAVSSTGGRVEAATGPEAPPEEKRRPLSVEGIRAEVAPSVGYVLTLQGAGSGVVITDDLLLTNAHVVWPANAVSLVFLNGAIHTGRVLAVDPFVDLALVDISNLTRKPSPIELGSLDLVAVDDSLWVIGYPAPRDFTPEVTIDSGSVTGFSDWDFTGATWVTVAAPAIAGQSGGALVDAAGRLVGITTFGSSTSLTSVSIDGILARVDRMLGSDEVRGLPVRSIPHGGSRRSLDVDLTGPWDQQIWLGWLPARSEVTISGAAGRVDLAVTDIEGRLVAGSSGDLTFAPGGLFPVLVSAVSPGAVAAELDASLPFVPYDDPDHGQVLDRHGTQAGIFDVGGDRDYFYLDLAAGELASVKVESAARTRLQIFDPDGAVVAGDDDETGFIANDASVRFVAAASGRYVVSLQSRLSSVSGYAIVTD